MIQAALAWMRHSSHAALRGLLDAAPCMSLSHSGARAVLKYNIYYIYIYVYIYIYIYIYVCVCLSLDVRMYIHICMYVLFIYMHGENDIYIFFMCICMYPHRPCAQRGRIGETRQLVGKTGRRNIYTFLSLSLSLCTILLCTYISHI